MLDDIVISITTMKKRIEKKNYEHITVRILEESGALMNGSNGSTLLASVRMPHSSFSPEQDQDRNFLHE